MPIWDGGAPGREGRVSPMPPDGAAWELTLAGEDFDGEEPFAEAGNTAAPAKSAADTAAASASRGILRRRDMATSLCASAPGVRAGSWDHRGWHIILSTVCFVLLGSLPRAHRARGPPSAMQENIGLCLQMASGAGFEPAAFGLGIQRSILLSYPDGAGAM